MIGKGNGTAGTAKYKAAAPAANKCSCTTAVEKQNYLLALGQSILHGSYQGTTEQACVSRFEFLPQIHHGDFRESGTTTRSDSLLYLHKLIFALLCFVKTAYIRGGTTQYDSSSTELSQFDSCIAGMIARRLIFLFVCPLMFFINDDKTKVRQRGK
jgi:hypothetical protein